MTVRSVVFENEMWREIDEFPHYLVSTHGRVRLASSIAPRKVSTNAQGAVILTLYAADSKTRYLRQVNQLVLLAFEGRPESNLTSVWHVDGDLTNCHIDNLQWASRRRVLEWNEMHRSGVPKIKTPRIKSNSSGEVYDSAFHCAMEEGRLESEVVFDLEYRNRDVYDTTGRYRYMLED